MCRSIRRKVRHFTPEEQQAMLDLVQSLNIMFGYY